MIQSRLKKREQNVMKTNIKGSETETIWSE
jgi:hypothetical protein